MTVSSSKTDYKKFCQQYRQRLGLIPVPADHPVPVSVKTVTGSLISSCQASDKIVLKEPTLRRRQSQPQEKRPPVNGYLPAVKNVRITSDYVLIARCIKRLYNRAGRNDCHSCKKTLVDTSALVIDSRYIKGDASSNLRRFYHLECAAKMSLIKKRSTR